MCVWYGNTTWCVNTNVLSVCVWYGLYTHLCISMRVCDVHRFVLQSVTVYVYLDSYVVYASVCMNPRHEPIASLTEAGVGCM